jgi:hypothetical protein
MTFAQAVKSQMTRTENGMATYISSGKRCVDLFSSVGEYRNADITAAFVAALEENAEREFFRKILRLLETIDPYKAIALAQRVPELGRWDDLLVFRTDICKKFAFTMIANGLQQKDRLCAKWMPRKGTEAEELRSFLRLGPKAYRKLLVSLTNVVETKMCAKQWNDIEFSHVPSVAAARYRKAFYRNAQEKFSAYVQALQNKEEGVKVNASAVFPHDVVRSLSENKYNSSLLSQAELNFITAQWEALPNYVGDARVLPLVDVSGSMDSHTLGAGNLTALDVAVSLGLYLSDKNQGAFKDMFMTFTSEPQLQLLQGNIVSKYMQLVRAQWHGSTNIEKAFARILEVATTSQVPAEEMPQTLLILSDMQFDQATYVSSNARAIDVLRAMYAQAGYAPPNVVFWNLSNAETRSLDKAVQFDESGTMISGFSPMLLSIVLSNSLESFTSESVMLAAIMKERYDWQ